MCLKLKLLFSYILMFFISMFSHSNAQTIEFSNKIDQLIYPDKNMAHYDNGFVHVSTSKIILFNEKDNSLKEKEWKTIKTQLCKFSDGGSFNPTFCFVKNDRIKVAIKSNGKKGRQIIVCTLDMDLNLIEEKLVAEIPYYEEKDKKNWAVSFHKSPKNNFYVFAQTLEFKPDFGKGDHLQYCILNEQFELVFDGKVDLPKPNSKDYYRNEKNVGSIFCLDEGDPIINFDGMLFLLGQKGAMQLNFELDYTINSYKILKLEPKSISLVGSYQANNGSGIALIKLDATSLEQIDQQYIPLNPIFDLTSEAIFEGTTKGNVSNQTKNDAIPIIFDAQLDNKGILRVMLVGYGSKTGSTNIDILGISKTGEVLFEKVVPKKYVNFEKLEVIFTSEKTIVFSNDHLSNFDETGNFKPSEKTNYNELSSGKLVNHFIVYNHQSDVFTNKIIDFKGNNVADYDNKLMTVNLIKSTTPTEKYYFISRYQPNNTNFGKLGKVYTLIGTVKND
jgi:hypothetical protein